MAKSKFKIKSRNDWSKEYKEKYSHIPLDIEDRLNYILKDKKMDDKFIAKVIANRNNILTDLHMERFEISIEEVPITAHRHRPKGYGKGNYTPNAEANTTFMKNKMVEEYLDEIKLLCRPAKIELLLYFPIPKGMPDDEKVLAELGLIRPVVMPDWDNSGKGYCDMMNKVVMLDDALFFEGRVAKYYSVKPRVRIIIHVQNKIYSKFILNKLKNSVTYKKLIAEGRIEDISELYGKIDKLN